MVRVIRWSLLGDEPDGTANKGSRERVVTMLKTMKWLLAGLCTGLMLTACGDTNDTAENTPAPSDGPTYHEHVQPILASSCGSCHSPGNVGPFTFSTYAEAYEYATLIQNSIASKRMPPMPPDVENCRPLDDERVMAPDDRAVVLAWIEAGMPEGDPALASNGATESALSSEDMLGMPTGAATWGYDFEPTPDVFEEHRCILVDPGWEEDVHLRAVGVEIDNPAVVHHVIQFAASPTEANLARIAELEAEDDIPGWACPNGSRVNGAGSIGGYAPGARNRPFPDGATLTLEAGTKVIMQMHYNYATARSADQTQTLFWEVDEPSPKSPRNIAAINAWFQIPEGAESHTAEGFAPVLPAGSQPGMATGVGTMSAPEGWAWAVNAHMHVRGKEVRIDRIAADGTEECMLHIPNWDFNWQGSYRFKEPMALNAGDTVRVRCTWDNSYENQPLGWDGEQQESRDIRFGDGTFDEMCLGIVQMTDFD